MASKITGTCTITRLRNGDTLYASINVNGSPCIFYDESRIITDFSRVNLLFTGSVASMIDASVEILSAEWFVNGVAIKDSTIYEVTNNTFRIKANPFNDVSSVKNLMIQWKPKVKSQGVEQNLTKVTEVTAVQRGQNSYWGSIQAASSSILSSSHTSVVLNQSLLLGGTDVNRLGYKVKWFVNGVQKSTSESVTITREDVNGVAYVSCEFYVGDNLVEADGITITDVTDETRIIINEHYEVAYGSTVEIVPKLAKISNDGSMEYVDNSVITWGVEVRNNYTLAVIPTEDYSFVSTVFSMQETEMYYLDGEVKKEYSPVVIFSATV